MESLKAVYAEAHRRALLVTYIPEELRHLFGQEENGASQRKRATKVRIKASSKKAKKK